MKKDFAGKNDSLLFCYYFCACFENEKMKSCSLYTLMIAIFTCLLTWQVQAVSLIQPEVLIADSLLTVNAIRKTSLADPDRALALLDMAESRKSMPRYQICWMRAQIYGGDKQMERIAVKWGKLALEDDSVRNNPQYYFNMCRNLVESMIATGTYDEAIRYARSMIDVLERAGKPKDNAYKAYWAIARVYRETGDPDKAYEEMRHAVNLCRQLVERKKKMRAPVVSLYLDLYGYYRSCSEWLAEDEKTDEALEAALRMQEVVEELRPLKGGVYPNRIPDKEFFSKEGGAAGMLSLLYERSGQADMGRKWFAKEQENPLAGKDVELLVCEIGYHESRGDYVRVAETARLLADPTVYEDTVCTGRRDACLLLADACRRLGKDREALEYYETATILADSLYRRNNRQDALEMATLLDTEGKERQIEVQAGELRWHRGVTAFALGMLLMAGIIFVLIVRHFRMVNRKNKSMAGQINLYLSYRDELQSAREQIRQLEEKVMSSNPATGSRESVKENTVGKEMPTDDDRALFDELDRQIREQQLFLDPTLTRDMILRLTPVGKNRISPLLQTFTGENFNGYINRLRLDYSLVLLKDFKHYTIEAVAIDSGFGNVRTYQRIFRDKYGMTPMEYRKTQG